MENWEEMFRETDKALVQRTAERNRLAKVLIRALEENPAYQYESQYPEEYWLAKDFSPFAKVFNSQTGKNRKESTEQ